jgi:hypothetical protein
MHLYIHQDMQACGGINPRSGIYREWVPAHNPAWVTEEDIAEGKLSSIQNIEGTNAALYEIQGNNNVVFTNFAKEALFYVKHEADRHSRFWNAFGNLKRLGFIYEVTQIWNDNPNGKNGRKAEPLYTLYVHDRHAREREPYLQKEVHEVAFRRDAMDRTYTFYDPDNESCFINTGRFRFIAHKETGGFPIGIYRLRFRPKTRDVGLGIDAEIQRFERWESILRKLY